MLVHVVRVLNICAHVLDDEIPAPPPASRTSLPSLPNAPVLSPIKRKSKTAVKDDSGSPAGQSPHGDKTAKGIYCIFVIQLV